ADDTGLPSRFANNPRWHDEAVAWRPALEALAREHLPAALRPSRYVFVRSLPLTVTGKTDRAALRARLAADGDAGRGSGAAERPMTSTERRVAAIWAELLRRNGIRAADDFFDLGGHSLLTFQLVFRLRKEFGVEVPIRAPFDASTVEAQANLVDESLHEVTGPARPGLVPVPRTGPIPASFAQERLWFLNQLEPDSAQYNFPVFLRLRGALDVRFLREAVNEVVARHEVLRTVLVPRDGRPFQTVLPPEPLDLPLVDLSGMDAAAREREAERLATRQYSPPFDLARPPVVRTGLLRMSDAEHILLLTVHHLSVDGWAAGLLRDELAESYTARLENRRPQLPELTVQYADYAVWQRRLLDEGHQNDLREYWHGHLDGILD
ncbi:MAG: condensation domain-containing protein, partial [Acidimicrobiales bacterium]